MLCFALLPVAIYAGAQKINKAKVGKAAPNFTLEDQNGKKVSLSSLKGKVVVLEWTNPDCPFVVLHDKLGTIKSLSQSYTKKGIVWLGINSTHYMNKTHNVKRIKAQKLNYSILDDHTGKVGRIYSAKTTPHIFIINQKGILVYEGAVDSANWGAKKPGDKQHVKTALDEILAGKEVSKKRTRPVGCTVKYARK